MRGLANVRAEFSLTALAYKISLISPAGAIGNPKFGVGDSFPRSPAKARRPSRIDPADH